MCRQRHVALILWSLLFAGGLASCSATEHLTKDQYLVRSTPDFRSVSTVSKRFKDTDSTVVVRKESKRTLLDEGLLSSSIRSKANRRMVIPKTYLHLYNLGQSLAKEEFLIERVFRFFFPKNPLPDSIANFLIHTAGEPPEILDTATVRTDMLNLKDVYFSRGFFQTELDYRIDTARWRPNKQKANLTFLIDEGPAAVINSIKWEVADRIMDKILKRNTQASFLRSGDLYTEDNFAKERSRIASVMRANGFYTFNPKMVSFDVDTEPDSSDLKDQRPNNPDITNYFPITVTVKIGEKPKRYEIGEVTMIIEPAETDLELDKQMLMVTNWVPKDSLAAWGLSQRLYDPELSKMTFLAYNRTLRTINLNFLEKHVTLETGQKYSLVDERKTQQRLQNLGIFKYVLIKHILDEENQKVNVTIQTVLLSKYQIKAGTEGFWETDPIAKSNFPGVGLELGFRDKMLFKGAEKLDLAMKGNISFFRTNVDSIKPLFEGTGQASLKFPRALLPFIGKRNFQRFEPSTNFVTTFSRQQSDVYTRNNLTLNWNYNWFHSSVSRNTFSRFSPLVVSLVASEIKDGFINTIKAIKNDDLRRLIIQDYRQRFNTYSRYEFNYSNYQSSRKEATLYIQPTLEIGGNIPYFFDRFLRSDGGYKDRKIGDIFYGQYYKASVEVKNFLPLGKGLEFVMRNFVGAAVPWNFTSSVPFEARYFAGGANTMRGWQSNTLGPGTYRPAFNTNDDSVLDLVIFPGGELMLEANFEFRGNVNSYIELAIFSDVGNVWFLPRSDLDLPGSKLDKKTILQLGWDVGVGLRFDFNFLIFRLDLAQQLYAPDIQDFVVKSFPRDLGANRFQYNFGIGYPF